MFATLSNDSKIMLAEKHPSELDLVRVHLECLIDKQTEMMFYFSRSVYKWKTNTFISTAIGYHCYFQQQQQQKKK